MSQNRIETLCLAAARLKYDCKETIACLAGKSKVDQLGAFLHPKKLLLNRIAELAYMPNVVA